MHYSKPVSTPVNPDIKLVPSDNPNDVCDQQMYQAVVGSRLYLSTKTRPDIGYAVSSAARFCAKPTKEHWTREEDFTIPEGFERPWSAL